MGKDLKSAWKDYDMFKCVKNIALAAKDLKSTTLSNCWRKLLPSRECLISEKETVFDDIIRTLVSPTSQTRISRNLLKIIQ